MDAQNPEPILTEQTVSIQPVSAQASPAYSRAESMRAFGDVVRNIIGDAPLQEAADRLLVGLRTLQDIMAGTKRINRRTAKEKHWERVFTTHYAKGWTEFGADFWSTLVHMQVSGVHTPKSPKESLGYVIWTIIGSSNHLISVAAMQVGVNHQWLSNIVHNRKSPTQESLQDSGLIRKLKVFYPEEFRAHERELQTFIDDLPHAKYRQRIVPEPKGQGKFGHILWRILGERLMDTNLAAEQLNISPQQLLALIRGDETIDRGTLMRNEWQSQLQKHYAENWAKYQGDYLACYAALPRFSAAREKQIMGRLQRLTKYRNKKNAKLKSAPRAAQKRASEEALSAWKLQAGTLLKSMRTTRSDDIADILDVLKTSALQNPETWQKLENGDASLPTRLFKLAMTEMVDDVYCLKPTTDEYYYAKRLIRNGPVKTAPILPTNVI